MRGLMVVRGVVFISCLDETRSCLDDPVMCPKGHGHLHCRFRNLLYRALDPQNSYGLGFQTL